MTELTDKEKIIKSIYEDKELGYGSLKDTYRQAVKKDPDIRLADVKNYLNKLEHRQTQFKYKGFNSFVSPHPLFEIEVDLIDLTKKAQENNGFRYCMVAIDNFTKFAWGVAIKTKQPTDVIKAFKEILEKIGIPKQIFRDQEGSWSTPEWKEVMRQHNIHDMISSTPPPFAERMVQTVKNMVNDQRRGLDIQEQRWIDILPRILKKYNNQEHSTIKMTPNNAVRTDHQIDVYFNIKQKAQFMRRYPPLNVGDEVRKYKKPDLTKKGYKPSWSGETFKVLSIVKDRGETRYNIDDYKLGAGGTRVRQMGSITRTFARNELLLVKGRETKDTV